MLQYRRLEVRDCQGTLWAFYREYQDDALASFEGALAALHLNEIPGASNQHGESFFCTHSLDHRQNPHAN